MLNEQGYEVPDNTPVEIPTRLRFSSGRAEQIRAFVRQELSRQAADTGQETFEEADDFELPDGEQWMSPYENDFDPPIPLEAGVGEGSGEAGGAKPPGDQAEPGEGAQPPVSSAGAANGAPKQEG